MVRPVLLRRLMLRHILLLALVTAAISAAAPGGGARACSAPACLAPLFVPATSMPASGQGIRMIVPGAFDPDLSELHVLHVTEAGEREIAATRSWIDRELELAFDEPLLEGETYVVRGTTHCVEAIASELTFVADAPAALPSALGELVLTHGGVGEVAVPVYGGGCGELVVAYYQHVEVALDGDAALWADSFLYTTYVDGEIYAPVGSILPHGGTPGGSWYGRGRDRIYTRCGALPPGAIDEGVAPGAHTVQIVARLPGTELTVSTEPIEVWLECPPTECETGIAPDCLPPMDCIDGWDAETGMCADPPGSEDPTATGSSGGGCSTVPGRDAAVPLIALVAVMLLVGRRRVPFRGRGGCVRVGCRPLSSEDCHCSVRVAE